MVMASSYVLPFLMSGGSKVKPNSWGKNSFFPGPWPLIIQRGNVANAYHDKKTGGQGKALYWCQGWGCGIGYKLDLGLAPEFPRLQAATCPCQILLLTLRLLPSLVEQVNSSDKSIQFWHIRGCLCFFFFFFFAATGFCVACSRVCWKKIVGTSGSVKELVMAGANSLADTCAINLVLQGLVCSAFWSTDWAWLLKYLLSYISAAWQAGKIAVCWYVRNMVGCLNPLWLWQWTQWLSFRREELLVMQCLSIWMIFGVLCYPTEIGLILTTCDRTRQNDHSRHHNPRSISHTLAPQFFFTWLTIAHL